MKKLESHPYADCFPLMSEDELRELAADIGDNGQRDPIKLFDGKILDGRNRYRACLVAGVEPEFEQFEGDDPLSFVISKNLRRRHLNESQRAMSASRIATLSKGQKKADVAIATSQSEAADALKVSRESVIRAKHVIEDGVPELIESVDSGEVSVSAAAEVSKLSDRQQRSIVKGGPDAIRQAAAESRAKCGRCSRLGLSGKDCLQCAELKEERKKRKALTPTHEPTGTIYETCKACRGSGKVAVDSKHKAAESVPIPAAIDSPAFRKVWSEWLADRKQRKKTVTPIAAERQLESLIPLAGDAAACVLNSIRNGWTGIFPERATDGKNGMGRVGRAEATPGKYSHLDQ